ncbi:hypothetical protein J3F84DRAFT_223042 [Trichoderma pleuroticola]
MKSQPKNPCEKNMRRGAVTPYLCVFLFVKWPTNTGTGSVSSVFCIPKQVMLFVSSVLHLWTRTTVTVRRHSRSRATIRRTDDRGIRQTSVEHAKFSGMVSPIEYIIGCLIINYLVEEQAEDRKPETEKIINAHALNYTPVLQVSAPISTYLYLLDGLADNFGGAILTWKYRKLVDSRVEARRSSALTVNSCWCISHTRMTSIINILQDAAVQKSCSF